MPKNPNVKKVTFIDTIDKGKMQCVRFTLDDGRTVESALEHHWKVFERHGKELDVTAKEIVDYIDSRKEYSNKHKNWYRIPNTAPIYHKDIYKDECSRVRKEWKDSH